MISLTHSQELQPMQSLGRLKKTPPSISIHSLGPPVPDSQPFCILRHLIHPSQAWSSSASSALRLIQGDFLHGRLACIRTTCPAHLSLFILIVVTKSTSSYKQYTSQSPCCLFTDGSKKFSSVFFFQTLLDATHQPYSKPKSPSHTSELVLLMSYI